MIAISVNSQKLDALRQRAMDAGQANEAATVGARAVKGFLVDYLADLDEARPNKMGGVRTHFFAQVARSVQNPKTEHGRASISINHVGFAQRLLGGIIRAGQGLSSKSGRPTKLLAIPARAEAYGKTPGEFHDLEFVPTGNGEGMLVQTFQTQFIRGRRKGDYHTQKVGGLAMFWLVKQVTQKPDATVLPSSKAMAGAATDAMEDYLNRKLSEGGKN